MNQHTRHQTRSISGKPSRGAGFTLIELLVVIAVIGILAGFIFSAVTSSQERAKITVTKKFIVEIDGALSAFETDFGHPPYNSKTGGATTNDREWIRLWLTGLKNNGDPDDSGANAVRENGQWNGPYIEPDPKMLDKTNNYIMIDAWENPIYFQFPITSVNPPIKPIYHVDRWDIWSLGPDGKGSTDMSAFQAGTYEVKRSTYRAYTEGGKEVNRDNIIN